MALLHKESSASSSTSEQAAVWKREKTYYYILALQESQKLLGGLDKTSGMIRLKGTVIALACMLQLVSFEVKLTQLPVVLFANQSEHRDR